MAERIDEESPDFARKLAGRELHARRRAARDHQRHAADPPADADVRPRSASIAPTCGSTSCVGNQALNLSQRDADVAIRATERPPETLVGRRAARIAWALYGRCPDFPQPGRPGPAALGSGPGWRSATISRRCRRRGSLARARRAERIVYSVNTVLGLAEAVEAGIGIGHLPCFIADARPRLIRWPHRTRTSPAISGCSPIPICATRRACACSSISSAAEMARHRRLIEGELGHPARP